MSYALKVKGVIVHDNLSKGQLISALSNIDGETDYNVLIDITETMPTPNEIGVYQRREKDLLHLATKIDFKLKNVEMNLAMRENKLRWESLTRLNNQFRKKHFFLIDKQINNGS